MVGERSKILLVDDELSLLVVMEQYLRRLGYDVVACRSGEEAWQAFQIEPAAFSLVLADITMPEMSGEELLQRMFQLNSDIGVVICSGYPFDASNLPVPVQQRMTFLQKPFTPRMLAEAIEKLIGPPDAASAS
jgi:CheY-like chemotaxis protein